MRVPWTSRRSKQSILKDINLKYSLEGTRAIWDITAVGWLLNDNNRFMLSRTVTAPLPTYDNLYSVNPTGHMMEYVYHIHRDALWADVIKKLT